MKDAALVRRLQRARDLQRKAYRLINRHRAMQWLTLDILEHEIALTDVVDLTDVRVVQCSNRPGLMLEATQPVGISGEHRRKNLDRHIAPEARVACPIHLAHAARADLSANFIRAESGTTDQGQTIWLEL
jgi:hypothetical protein